MKKLLLISVLYCVTIAVHAQNNMRCVAVTQKVATIYSQNAFANVGIKKTIRVIIHFPLYSNGTGNFTETKDCFGNVSYYNGYWFAEKFVERANVCLRNNESMTQQLSYRSIPVKPINLQLELAGVLFHRNDNLFIFNINDDNNKIFTNNTTLERATTVVDNTNIENAIHVFLYKGHNGYGISSSSGNVCVVQGVDEVYNEFISHNMNNWYFDGLIVRLSLHEIGHCLSLKHPKRSDGGQKCDSKDCNYDDECSDTPSYQELLADGYTDPYNWCEGEYSNNFMDYSCSQTAWTPCQIEKAHKNIAQRVFLCTNAFKNNSSTLTSNVNQNNKVVIAKKVVAKNISVSNNKALFVNCDEFQTNGSFEVALGSTLEIK